MPQPIRQADLNSRRVWLSDFATRSDNRSGLLLGRALTGAPLGCRLIERPTGLPSVLLRSGNQLEINAGHRPSDACHPLFYRQRQLVYSYCTLNFPLIGPAE